MSFGFNGARLHQKAICPSKGNMKGLNTVTPWRFRVEALGFLHPKPYTLKLNPELLTLNT